MESSSSLCTCDYCCYFAPLSVKHRRDGPGCVTPRGRGDVNFTRVENLLEVDTKSGPWAWIAVLGRLLEQFEGSQCHFVPSPKRVSERLTGSGCAGLEGYAGAFGIYGLDERVRLCLSSISSLNATISQIYQWYHSKPYRGT